MTNDQDHPVPAPMFDVVNYTQDQEGQDIREEDVVRPANHRYTIDGNGEAATWKLKNHSRTMTYGTCDDCFKAGPNGMPCLEHGGDYSHRYIMFTIRQHKFLPGRLIDSLTLAEMFGLGHQVARADGLVYPVMQHKYQFNHDVYDRIIHRQTIIQDMRPTESVAYAIRMERYNEVFKDDDFVETARQRYLEREQATISS